nr:uncharacterized protein LOC103348439 [Oryctolagus cuniculus]
METTCSGRYFIPVRITVEYPNFWWKFEHIVLLARVPFLAGQQELPSKERHFHCFCNLPKSLVCFGYFGANNDTRKTDLSEVCLAAFEPNYYAEEPPNSGAPSKSSRAAGGREPLRVLSPPPWRDGPFPPWTSVPSVSSPPTKAPSCTRTGLNESSERWDTARLPASLTKLRVPGSFALSLFRPSPNYISQRPLRANSALISSGIPSWAELGKQVVPRASVIPKLLKDHMALWLNVEQKAPTTDLEGYSPGFGPFLRSNQSWKSTSNERMLCYHNRLHGGTLSRTLASLCKNLWSASKPGALFEYILFTQICSGILASSVTTPTLKMCLQSSLEQSSHC